MMATLVSAAGKLPVRDIHLLKGARIFLTEDGKGISFANAKSAAPRKTESNRCAALLLLIDTDSIERIYVLTSHICLDRCYDSEGKTLFF